MSGKSKILRIAFDRHLKSLVSLEDDIVEVILKRDTIYKDKFKDIPAESIHAVIKQYCSKRIKKVSLKKLRSTYKSIYDEK